MPGTFSVITLNVLAQAYIRPKQYPYAKPGSLRWAYRQQLVSKFLHEQQPDIFCLQEVDKFDEFFAHELHKVHYTCIYKRRGTTDAKQSSSTSDTSRIKKPDGCLTAFREEVFELVPTKNVQNPCFIEFDDLARDRSDYEASKLQRHNVAILTVLRRRSDGRRILLGNGHLFWSKRITMKCLCRLPVLLISCLLLFSSPHIPTYASQTRFTKTSSWCRPCICWKGYRLWFLLRKVRMRWDRRKVHGSQYAALCMHVSPLR